MQDHLKSFRHRILASSAPTHANMAVAGLENFLKVDVSRLTRNVFPQEAGPFQIDVSIFSPALVQQQPRSQGSLLRALRSERERSWKTPVTWLQNKINSEGGVLCLTFFCLVYSQRSRSDRNSKIDLLTLLQL